MGSPKARGRMKNSKRCSSRTHLMTVTLPETFAQTSSKAGTPALPTHGSSTLSQKEAHRYAPPPHGSIQHPGGGLLPRGVCRLFGLF